MLGTGGTEAVTPTNLLYNVVATPGALDRYWRQGQPGRPLAWLLIAGTLPGVVAGSIIRVERLLSPRVFDLVAAVLFPLGGWLALTRPGGAPDVPPGDPDLPPGDPAAPPVPTPGRGSSTGSRIS